MTAPLAYTQTRPLSWDIWEIEHNLGTPHLDVRMYIGDEPEAMFSVWHTGLDRLVCALRIPEQPYPPGTTMTVTVSA